MYKAIRDMGLDPLHGNGWKLIETEKMNAIYAAKAYEKIKIAARLGNVIHITSHTII